MIAVIPVRDGMLPLGADEAVAEAGGRVLVVGEAAAEAACTLEVAASVVRAAEAGSFAPTAWAAALAPLLVDEEVVILPASADGRDLAPRLAYALRRPLLAGAIEIRHDRAVLARAGGLVAEDHTIDGPVIATLIPGVRGAERGIPAAPEAVSLAAVEPRRQGHPTGSDAEVISVTPPDPATMDLSEAPRIIAGGAGLPDPGLFAVLAHVAAALGASYGASRVVADAGWVPHDRYIGTTGVCVDPRLYVAFGISGAVQHVTGLGNPERIISVNLDPSCPMMLMADLAVVADAPATLLALARRLGAAGEATAPATGDLVAPGGGEEVSTGG